ncbi:glycosyltransferase [Fulvimarina sp. MAC3]|uniref:glycosyltransferase n=1 Tax=Fulvimarina sp. MAC3 TaxID=3148887 RepID=UPI0031FD3F57
MRVLHFFKTYHPDTFGGVERTIHAIARSTAPLGVETTVLSLSRDPQSSPATFSGHRLIKARLDLDIASTGLSREAFALFRDAAQEADIVHYHFPWPFMDLVHFASRHGKPSLVTYHSDIVKQRMLKRLYAPLMHRFLGSADRIVATSPGYIETSPVLSRYREKVSLVPIGLDTADYPRPAPEAVERWRNAYTRPMFVFSGVLRYYKGLHVLVAAAKAVNAEIVIIGKGPMEAELLRQAENSGARNIHFVGAIDDEEKMAALSAASGFVFPATQRSEAFGLALLEGAMAGLPLVSTELGTGTSFVNLDGVSGIVVPPDNPEALAAAMNTIIDNDTLAARFGAGARDRFETLFTASAMGQSYLRIYEKLLSR